MSYYGIPTIYGIPTMTHLNNNNGRIIGRDAKFCVSTITSHKNHLRLSCQNATAEAAATLRESTLWNIGMRTT